MQHEGCPVLLSFRHDSTPGGRSWPWQGDTRQVRQAFIARAAAHSASSAVCHCTPRSSVFHGCKWNASDAVGLQHPPASQRPPPCVCPLQATLSRAQRDHVHQTHLPTDTLPTQPTFTVAAATTQQGHPTQCTPETPPSPPPPTPTHTHAHLHFSGHLLAYALVKDLLLKPSLLNPSTISPIQSTCTVTAAYPKHGGSGPTRL